MFPGNVKLNGTRNVDFLSEVQEKKRSLNALYYHMLYSYQNFEKIYICYRRHTETELIFGTAKLIKNELYKSVDNVFLLHIFCLVKC